MQYKNFFSAVMSVLMIGLMILSAVSFTSCSVDNDEPDDDSNPTVNGDNNSVVINSDGTATGGAVFIRINDTTFFLDNVKYEIVDSHLEIIGVDGLGLPSKPKLYDEVIIEGSLYKTRVIREDAFNCEPQMFYDFGITSIIIPSSVLEIDSSAFENCRSLTSITLPQGLQSIGNHCFDGCI